MKEASLCKASGMQGKIVKLIEDQLNIALWKCFKVNNSAIFHLIGRFEEVLRVLEGWRLSVDNNFDVTLFKDLFRNTRYNLIYLT